MSDATDARSWRLYECWKAVLCALARTSEEYEAAVREAATRAGV